MTIMIFDSHWSSESPAPPGKFQIPLGEIQNIFSPNYKKSPKNVWS